MCMSVRGIRETHCYACAEFQWVHVPTCDVGQLTAEDLLGCFDLCQRIDCDLRISWPRTDILSIPSPATYVVPVTRCHTHTYWYTYMHVCNSMHACAHTLSPPMYICRAYTRLRVFLAHLDCTIASWSSLVRKTTTSSTLTKSVAHLCASTP